jgi:ABC-type uncharacterized transport system substrate-binding protein
LNFQLPTHTFTTPGIKEVAVLLNDSENCGSSFSDTLFISAKSSGYTVTVIHYNDLVANIDNIEQTISSKVFPNPVNEKLYPRSKHKAFRGFCNLSN